jgi:hypothetical protein
MRVAFAPILFSLVMSQNSAIIAALCEKSPTAPHCVTYNEACKNSTTSVCSQENSMSVLAAMCASEFKGSTQCAKMPSSSPNKLFETLPTLAEASKLVQGICTDMPSMKLCSECPAPFTNCDVFRVYMGLCTVHSMPQCAQYDNICTVANAERIGLSSLCANFDLADDHSNHDHDHSNDDHDHSSHDHGDISNSIARCTVETFYFYISAVIFLFSSI